MSLFLPFGWKKSKTFIYVSALEGNMVIIFFPYKKAQ